MGHEGRYNLFIRAEFQNIFNRHFLSARAVGPNVPYAGPAVNPTTVPTSTRGIYTGGYGYIAMLGGAGVQPRAGQVVARTRLRPMQTGRIGDFGTLHP
jgi:hypothetical protein